MSDNAAMLRRLPVFRSAPPPFDPASAPAVPVELFGQWLRHAVDAGVPEPHAATLATVDGTGRPSARVLLLKDFAGDGWHFSSTSAGRKGAELTGNPGAALTFHWPTQARQIRIRGTVHRASAELSARDFRARSASARAETLVGRQGQVLTDRSAVEPAVAEAAQRLAADPTLVAAHWTRYVLDADEVEFWQADPGRRHLRLRYRRIGRHWVNEELWP
ncbi:pyridoxine/pyridoxamine 5'-phosphate oxidase [Umezawaea beigongshangensis]|uniref:pyridoxine/pyridoxamine 5'-phosphate oxidase n=1 Tax=Umezawaea beigongshangensis TaxID=2780383 RepID=UPI001E3CF1D6|nr:pyridoxal 5'-phosphate synthase [Umezawaea beigongshangensis]